MALRPDAQTVEPSFEAVRVHARPPAFESIAREHGPAVRAFALRLAGKPADAHDLAQDCLERALRGFHRLKPGTNPRAWLFAILHNAFIDRCRRRRAERVTDDIDALEVPSPEPIDPPPWASVSTEQLAAAVAKLDDEFRSVYRLHIEGASYQDIAARLGIPINTVGTRLTRARAKLRVLLENALAGEEGSP